MPSVVRGFFFPVSSLHQLKFPLVFLFLGHFFFFKPFSFFFFKSFSVFFGGFFGGFFVFFFSFFFNDLLQNGSCLKMSDLTSSEVVFFLFFFTVFIFSFFLF